MANAIDVLANLVREELPSVIHESLPEIAPVYNYIKTTSLGVQRSTGIGRGWQVEWLFNTGLAGLIQPVSNAGPAMRTNTGYPMSEFLTDGDASLNIFPDATKAPHVSNIKRVLSLQKSTGNFSVPITWKTGDALDASQIGQVARDIKAVGQLRALVEANSFFMASNNALCSFTGGTLSNGSATDDVVTITPTAGTGNIQFFRIGMMVDFWVNNAGVPAWGVATDGTKRINYKESDASYIPCVVSKVDYLAGTVSIASVNAEALTTANMKGSGDFTAGTAIWVTLAYTPTAAQLPTSSREMRTWGIEDWIASSGTILQREGAQYYNYNSGTAQNEGINLDTYPQFRSFLSTVNAPLTEDILNRFVGGFLNAYPGATLDSIITTMGVTMKFLQQPTLYNNRMNFDRTGKTLNYSAGWDEVTYSFNGKSMRWIVAPMAIAGRLYALKFNNNNIQRFAPPMVGGTSDQVSDVEFLAPLGGNNGIFMIARNSGGLTDVLEAPFWQYALMAPVDVRGVKLSSLTEATFTQS